MIFINESNRPIEVSTYNDYDVLYTVPFTTFQVQPGTLHRHDRQPRFKLWIWRLDGGGARTILMMPRPIFDVRQRLTVDANFTITTTSLFVGIPNRPPNPPSSSRTWLHDEGFQVSGSTQQLVSTDGQSTLSLTPGGQLSLEESGNPNPAWVARHQATFVRLFDGQLLLQDAVYNVVASYSGVGGASSMTLHDGCTLVISKPSGYIVSTRLRGGSGTGFYPWEGAVSY